MRRSKRKNIRPLMIVKLPDGISEDSAREIDKHYNELSKGLLSGYDIIVQSGLEIKVYYPSKPISFYYQKLKTWLILKIVKKR